MSNLLFLKLLESSPEIEIDGETIIDLTVPILNRNQRIDLEQSSKVYEVGSELICKPTILSKFVYGNAGSIDMLAYYNGYSNPFAMTPGTLIKVPRLENIESIISKGQEKNVNIAKVALNKKASVVDAKKRGLVKGDLERPNFAKVDKVNKKKGELVILGEYSDDLVKIKFSQIKDKNLKDKQSLEENLIDHFEERLKLQ